jgi:hypothetical protein
MPEGVESCRSRSARNTKPIESGVKDITSQDIRVQWEAVWPAENKILGPDMQ